MTTYVVTDYNGCDYITAGKRYEVTGKSPDGFFIVDDDENTTYCTWKGSAHIGNRDWIVIEESATLKTWGEMTDAEKGALLLAHHEGKVIESRSADVEIWHVAINPAWVSWAQYRIKQEPVAGELVLHARDPHFYKWAGREDNEGSHTLTLPTLDGNLVCGEFTDKDGNTVKVEEKK